MTIAEHAGAPPPDDDDAAAAPHARLVHDAAPWQLFAIHLVNLGLTLATLGIFRFWAKTRIRQYLWTATSFHDDRFEYTGTGKELFLGFVVVLIVLSLAGAAYNVLHTAASVYLPAATRLLEVLLVAGIVALIGMARFRARRYRLSRTVWRGIRGAQTGSAVAYGFYDLALTVLTVCTFGLYWPFRATRLAAYKLGNTWFGDRPFRFDGAGEDLFWRFVLCWLLTLPTLGLCWFWYRAAALRYYTGRTRYEGLGFAARVRGGPLLRLLAGNLALSVATLGLAYPYVLIRNARFVCTNLEIVGEQDFARVAQSLERMPTTGEGLAAMFDLGDF